MKFEDNIFSIFVNQESSIQVVKLILYFYKLEAVSIYLKLIISK